MQNDWTMNIKQNVMSHSRITHDKFHTKIYKMAASRQFFLLFFNFFSHFSIIIIITIGPLTKKYLLARSRKKFPADLLIWQIYTAMSANDLINFWEQTILK